MLDLLKILSTLAVPLVILVIVTVGAIRRVKVYEEFVEGAKEGFTTAVRIIPYLVAMLCAIGMFRASGAMDILTAALAPLTSAIGIPSEVFPLAIIRNLSGSGSLGLMTDLAKTYGADSFIGRLSAVMMGSHETTFYVLAVYFGSVGVKKARHAPLSGIFADIVSVIISVILVRAMFS
ncbi:MAG: spore maturation protein [Ignavibacteriota bacterium]